MIVQPKVLIFYDLQYRSGVSPTGPVSAGATLVLFFPSSKHEHDVLISTTTIYFFIKNFVFTYAGRRHIAFGRREKKKSAVISAQ